MSFEDMITRKYQILGETANSERDLRTAQSGLLQSQTATNPAEAAAREAQAYGAAEQSRGLGGYYSALGTAEPGLATSEIGLRGAQANQSNAEAESQRSLNTSNPALDQLLRQRTNASGLNSFAKGTDKVPGKTPPAGAKTTDTTPAMLTPGEAVLNVGAAEHLGRDTIDVLNAIGNIKMMSNGAGATQGAGPATKADVHGAGGIPGYAQGSSGIDPVPGQGGTWGPSGDAAPAPGSNTGIRASVNLPGVARPTPPTVPKPPAYAMGTSNVADGMSELPGYADGTSQVMAMTHADAARNAKAGGEDSSPKRPGGPQSNADLTNSSANTPGRSPPGYAKGTSKVPGKSAAPAGGKGPAKGASKVTPEMIQAIMNLGKGGGGLIPPGQGSPMPMPMPQVAPGGGMR